MDPALFEVPRGYSVVGAHQDALREDEDDLLQFAIQQSLLEAGSEYDQVGTDTSSASPCPLPQLGNIAAHPVLVLLLGCSPHLDPSLCPAVVGQSSCKVGHGSWDAGEGCHPPSSPLPAGHHLGSAD